MWQMWQFVNENTPRDARLASAAFYTSISASSAGTFWIDRTCFTSDSHLQTFIQLDSWGSFLHSMSQAGIGYVLIFQGQFSPGRHGVSFAAERNEYPFFRRLVDFHGQKLAQFGHLQLYRVDTVSAGARSAAAHASK
jgi:hypothetical protein